jgi:hypothetical protein
MPSTWAKTAQKSSMICFDQWWPAWSYMTAATDVEVVPHQGIQAWLNRPDIPLAGFSAGDKSVPVHDTYEDIVSILKRFTKPPHREPLQFAHGHLI